MARSPVLTSSSLTPFGGGGAGLGAFNIINPGQTAYLAFLKVKVRWEAGEIPNSEYLAAYETYVSKLKEGTTNRINAQQSLDETKYRLARNDIMADIENGTADWDDLLAFDRSKLEGLNTESQTYVDRLELYRSTQSRRLQEAAEAQHDLYDAGKLSTAQLRQWYLDQAADPDLALNPELSKSIADQVESLDLRLTSEADQHMLDQFRDGKVGNQAFLAYATAARARYASGTEDQKRWDDIITDAKAVIAEQGLTYRYGLSQDYIQLRKFIADQKEMLSRAGQSSTSTSQRIVLGANGQWKTVTSTSTNPYRPSAAEQAAMRDRRIELASAQRQLAEWERKIRKSGGFVSTNRMIDFYQGRQAEVVKGTDEWYQLQARIDGLQQQKFQEQILRREGVRIGFGGGDGPSVGGGRGGGGRRGGGAGGTSYSAGGGAGSAESGRGGAGSGQGGRQGRRDRQGPLEIVTGSREVPKWGTVLETKRVRFPSNLDGSAFLKFYSGFVAAYESGATTFTDYSSGKPVTYYLPEDPGERVKMIGELDDMRINYYAVRAQVYAGTPSEIIASNEYSDAIKDKAENAYLILVTEAKGGRILPTGKGIVNPIEQGLKVRDAAQGYYEQQVKLAEQAWERGDVTGAWAHLQLATRRVAETEARIKQYLGVAQQSINQIYRATGEAPPEQVEGALGELEDWAAVFGTSKNDATKLSNEVYKWAKLGANGQPIYNPDGTLSLHDGAAIMLSADGKVTYKEVASAGYSAPGSNQQIPDMPGHVRVTVNLGGTVPSQVVYAKWTTGIVGYTATGQPVQGKVVSGFLNGQRYTLVENPFAPGRWSLGNQVIKVPDTFKPVAGQDGVYQFNDGKQNYLLEFNKKTGTYEVVTPGNPFKAEETVPLTEADAQSLLQGLGFGLDTSAVPPSERWKYDLTQPYAGFNEQELRKFTTPPPGQPLHPMAQNRMDEEAAILEGKRGLYQRSLEAKRQERYEAIAEDRRISEEGILEGKRGLYQRQLAAQQRDQSTTQRPPEVRDRWYADQQAQQGGMAHRGFSGLEAREGLRLERQTAMELRFANLQREQRQQARQLRRQAERDAATADRTRRTRRAGGNRTTPTTTAPRLPTISATKIDQLEKLL